MIDDDNKSDNENNAEKTNVIKNRLGNCEVCAIQLAKYTCPKCEVKTCCLNCQKIHKQELNCDGIRDKTKYIPLNKFTDMDMSSDYRLLEECGRTVENLRKDLRKVHKPHLPRFLINLKQAAFARKIGLKTLPMVFTKRKNNTTYYNFKEKTIFWRIEWIFPGETDITLINEQVSEKEKLKTVLSKHLKPQEDAVLQENLQFYQSAGINNVHLLMKAENKSKNGFYELDMDSTLVENLRNKIVIEYPTIYVILKHNLESYDVMDSDEEDDASVCSSNPSQVVEKIIKSDEQKTASVNYLFSTDQDLSD